MPSYSRTDVGLTYVFFDKGLPLKSKLNLHPLTSTTLTFEVLNLFDIRNTSSYLWVQTLVHNGTQSVAVPNYLTSRRFNVKLMIEF
ncbi:hypothetical protein FACS189467_2130 [Bacteroidia bacterium]|nr:hypothetical protein FACS189467_2130 [Bacteroidia bacterium]